MIIMATYFEKRSAKKRKSELEKEYIKKDKEFDYMTQNKDELTKRAIGVIESENDDKPLSEEKIKVVSKAVQSTMDYITSNRDRYINHFKDIIKYYDDVREDDPERIEKLRNFTAPLRDSVISIIEDSLTAEENAMLTDDDKKLIYVVIQVGFIKPYTRHRLAAQKYGDMMRAEDQIINSKKNDVDY